MGIFRPSIAISSDFRSSVICSRVNLARFYRSFEASAKTKMKAKVSQRGSKCQSFLLVVNDRLAAWHCLNKAFCIIIADLINGLCLYCLLLHNGSSCQLPDGKPMARMSIMGYSARSACRCSSISLLGDTMSMNHLIIHIL